MVTRVFITGIGGFIGSHLSEFLAKKGCEVWGSYFRPTNDMSVPASYAKGLFNIDVRQRSHLEDALQKVRPHVVYHLAAQSYPMVSYKEPEYTVESNVMGTLNLLKPCFISTFEEHGYFWLLQRLHTVYRPSEAPYREPALPPGSCLRYVESSPGLAGVYVF